MAVSPADLKQQQTNKLGERLDAMEAALKKLDDTLPDRISSLVDNCVDMTFAD